MTLSKLQTLSVVAWSPTLVYIFGYLIVAYNPSKHSGIVIVGGIGKLGFAIKLLQLYQSNLAHPIVFIVILGDFLFSLLQFVSSETKYFVKDLEYEKGSARGIRRAWSPTIILKKVVGDGSESAPQSSPVPASG